MKDTISFRETVRPDDVETIRTLARSSGYFTAEEIAIAVELIEERLARGKASGYEFIFAELDGRTVGYTCFGLIGCTKASYDLYWIVVDDAVRGKKIGTALLEVTEKTIASIGGRRVYAETSSKPQYESTRQFYLRKGYFEEAVIKDFYDTNDSKVIYVKVV